jgi:hypothetical protein
LSSANKRSNPSVILSIAEVGAARSARTAAAPFVAEASPGLLRLDHRDQRGDVGEAEVETLSGEGMDDVRRVARQDPGGAAPGRGAADGERPRRPARRPRRRSPALAAVASTSSASKAAGSAARSATALSAGNDQTKAYERSASGPGSNGRRASTSGERNTARATWPCGRAGDQPRGDRLLLVGAGLDPRAQAFQRRRGAAFAVGDQVRRHVRLDQRHVRRETQRRIELAFERRRRR